MKFALSRFADYAYPLSHKGAKEYKEGFESMQGAKRIEAIHELPLFQYRDWEVAPTKGQGMQAVS